MAEAKTINTRIVLRNDLISKWMTSDKALLKGEAALALRPDGNYEIRFGSSDSLSTWSLLSSKGQLVIPAKNVEFLTYQEYQLSSLTTSEGEQSKFLLWGKRSDTAAWESIGAAITVPEVDFGPVNAKIEYLSGAIDKLSSDLSGEINALSTSLSTTVDSLVSTTKSDVLTEVKNVSAETLISAAADATSKANQALADAKTYTNEVSTALSTDYQGQINKIKTEIADGIHFIGHVAAYGLTKDGETVTGGWYKLKADGLQIAAKNGDLIIYNNKEYIWSNALKSWDEFGDEGNYATKQYVDDKASAAESNAISATENNVYQETNLTDEQVTNYLSASNKNVGDVLINKKDIKDNTGTSVGKQEYTAYSWDGSAWTAMDGNYSATNVYFNDNITMAGNYTNVGAVSKGSTAAVSTFEVRGKSVAQAFSDIFLKDTDDASITLPNLTCVVTNGSQEVGNTVNPTYKLTINAGSYTYGSINADGTYNSGTGVLKNVLSAADSLGFTKTDVVSNNAFTSNQTYTYTDSALTILTGYYSWNAGNTPATMAHNKSTTKTGIAASSKTLTANFPRGNRLGFYGYRTYAEGPIACTDGTVGTFDRTKITSSNIRNDIHATTFIANNNNTAWPTTFLVKGGSQQIIFAVPHNALDWSSHKYIKMSNIALGTYYFANDGLLYTDCNLSVKGANDYEGIAYDIWCINPTGPFDADTTYTIEYGSTKRQ